MARHQEAPSVPSFCAAVARSTTVNLYEGLPHQHFERALLDQERRAKSLREFGGFPFYDEALTLAPVDVNTLRVVLSSPVALEEFSGEKFCGGFHPDFAVEWFTADTYRQSLICFGCAEVISIEAGTEVRSDLAKSVFVRLYEVLRPYRKNRPGPIPPPLPKELLEVLRNSEATTQASKRPGPAPQDG
jgi:hypothetical protein